MKSEDTFNEIAWLVGFMFVAAVDLGTFEACVTGSNIRAEDVAGVLKGSSSTSATCSSGRTLLLTP